MSIGHNQLFPQSEPKMRRVVFSLLFAACMSQVTEPSWAGEATSHPVTMKWLGTAGWEIRVGSTVILIDPFLTRRPASAAEEWKTNEEEVLKNIDKADFIFAGHSHADHIADVPFIAKRFGSKVIGSRTTTNIALTAGVSPAQLTTISGGEKLEFPDFTVEIIESEHGVLTRSSRRRQPKFEEQLKPWSGPIRGDAFVEGGSYLYCFTFGKLRILHQSTGNFVEERLAAIQPDVALLADNSNYDWLDALKLLKPKTVIIHHYDEWRTPLSEGIPESNRRRAQRFEKIIKGFDRNIKVVIPELLKPIALE
jgi:L-ascorbate metabolism protein UlaG (beta-lactamase superfamily)